MVSLDSPGHSNDDGDDTDARSGVMVARSDAAYAFENAETGETRDHAGEELIRQGFTLSLPARSGAIWFYRAL